MDDALVEKVARAMCRYRIEYFGPKDVRSLEERIDGEWQDWEDIARAALAIAYPAGVKEGLEMAAKVADHFHKQSSDVMKQVDMTAENLTMVVPLVQLSDAIATAIRSLGPRP